MTWPGCPRSTRYLAGYHLQIAVTAREYRKHEASEINGFEMPREEQQHVTGLRTSAD